MIFSDQLNIEFYKNVINTLPYSVVVCDNNNDFLLWNKATNSIATFNKNVTNRTDLWEKKYEIWDADKTRKIEFDELPISRALKGDTVVDFIVLLLNENNPKGIYLKISAFPLLDENTNAQSGAMGIFEDITKKQTSLRAALLELDAVTLEIDEILVRFKGLRKHLI